MARALRMEMPANGAGRRPTPRVPGFDMLSGVRPRGHRTRSAPRAPSRPACLPGQGSERGKSRPPRDNLLYTTMCGKFDICNRVHRGTGPPSGAGAASTPLAPRGAFGKEFLRARASLRQSRLPAGPAPQETGAAISPGSLDPLYRPGPRQLANLLRSSPRIRAETSCEPAGEFLGPCEV